MRPTECKWCGCGSVYSVSDRHVKFTCRSAWTADGDCWACSSQCCDGMRDRIQRAVEVLEGGERIMMMLDDDDEDVSFVVPATDVDRAIEILGGEEDEQAE